MMRKNKLIIFISIITLSCSPKQQKSIDVINNGVTISYEIHGTGSLTLLFVHGWCIDKSYWNDQVKYFSDSYKVVTIDLAGHGESCKNRPTWTVEDYASDVIAVIEQLTLTNVVLIGHSMGGDIILETALQKPDEVEAIVGIDNFKDVGVKYNEETREAIDQFFALLNDDFPNTASGYARDYLFQPDADSISKSRVMKDYANADKSVAVPTLRNLFEYGPKELEKLKSLQKPFILVNSDVPETDTTAFVNNNIDYKILYVEGTGHFPMIEKPEEFNRQLEKALESLTNQP